MNYINEYHDIDDEDELHEFEKLCRSFEQKTFASATSKVCSCFEPWSHNHLLKYLCIERLDQEGWSCYMSACFVFGFHSLVFPIAMLISFIF